MRPSPLSILRTKKRMTDSRESTYAWCTPTRLADGLGHPSCPSYSCLSKIHPRIGSPAIYYVIRRCHFHYTPYFAEIKAYLMLKTLLKSYLGVSKYIVYTGELSLSILLFEFLQNLCYYKIGLN